MADFWLKHKGRYPPLAEARLPAFNWQGLGAYVIGSAAAYASPVLPPVAGVVAAVIGYGALSYLTFRFAAVTVAKS